jgi:DNA polymerase III epsilon subunit-like protein
MTGRVERRWRDYTVVDLETTGIDTAHCRVAELGAVRVRDGKIVDRFETLVRLPDDLTFDETKTLIDVCGLDPSDCANAPTLGTAWADFLAFVDGEALVAYNGATFDFPVMDRVCRELGLEKSWKREHDMLVDARLLLPHLKRHSAQAVRKHLFGADAPDTAHRALADCVDQATLMERFEDLRSDRAYARGYEPYLSIVALAMTSERETTLADPESEERVLYGCGYLWLARRDHPVTREAQRELPDGTTAHAALTMRQGHRNALEYLPKTLRVGRSSGNLTERLTALLTPYRTLKLCDGHTQDLLARLALWDETETGAQPDVVSVTTYHSAKGLEFDYVFCTGVTDGAFPWFFRQTPLDDPNEERARLEEIAESRRVLYVGLTRAKRHLIVTYHRDMWGRKVRASTFLGDVPKGTYWHGKA